MKIFNSLESVKDIGPTVIALGNFDGIHLGHQAIIKKAIYDAKGEGYKSAVFTFANHPRNLLKNKESVKNILYSEDKWNVIDELGIDYLFNIPFTEEIMTMSPQDFIDEILVGKFNMKEVLCGFNYHFGYKAEGDIELLVREGIKKGFGVHVTEPYTIDDQVVSSSLIREKIAEGDMVACSKLLGRNYSIEGKVVVGNRLGKKLGFPTSNINIDESMVSPPNGVYVTKCIYNGVSYPSITNVGKKPTIGEYSKNVETHIFNFDKELYGKTIRVEFLEKLRDEKKFDSVEDLSKQITADCITAKAYHRQHGLNVTKVGDDNSKASKSNEINEESDMLPRQRIPYIGGEPDKIKNLIADELILDGKEKQNFATFCQTYGASEIRDIMDDSLSKNMMDMDQYGKISQIEERCINMIANLWNAPRQCETIGTSTVGSSEACMLAGLAMLRRWRKKRKAEGKDISKPNLVCGPVQICWHKFARYWDVELREVHMERKRYHISPKDLEKYIDENTIGVVVTLGLTFTGEYEPIKAICKELEKIDEEKGLSVDVHIDAASGGFLAPFCAPELEWDFRLEKVKSISASGHKYGLAPLGCGWVLWKDKKYLPEELIFYQDYNDGEFPVFQLNFSRPAGQIVSQYYLFVKNGFEGYKRIHEESYKQAMYLAEELKQREYFHVIFDGNPQKGIPAVSWEIKEGKDGKKPHFDLYELAERLKNKGWLVPAYPLPSHAKKVVVQRVLIRQGMNINFVNALLRDIDDAVEFLKR